MPAQKGAVPSQKHLGGTLALSSEGAAAALAKRVAERTRRAANDFILYELPEKM
jgi:hypothetical protein